MTDHITDTDLLNFIIDTALDFYPSAEGSNTTEHDFYAVALNFATDILDRRAQVREYLVQQMSQANNS